jgi:hypothetical protein
MRFHKGGLTLLATVLALGAALVFVDVVLAGFGCEVGGVFRSVQALEEEWALSEKLEEKFHLVVENAGHKRRVLHDLIEKRCDLREAVSRYLSLCTSADLLSLRAAYHQPQTAENPVIARHLLNLAERELQHTGQPLARVSQLEQEWARLQAERPEPTSPIAPPGA